MIFYTDRFIPEGAAGCCRVFLIPFVFIRPKYRDDLGLLAHELCHEDQAWSYGFPPIHALRYALSKSYRLACEVEAYREQALYYPDDRRERFAGFISRDYGLNVTAEEALRLLKGQ